MSTLVAVDPESIVSFDWVDLHSVTVFQSTMSGYHFECRFVEYVRSLSAPHYDVVDTHHVYMCNRIVTAPKKQWIVCNNWNQSSRNTCTCTNEQVNGTAEHPVSCSHSWTSVASRSQPHNHGRLHELSMHALLQRKFVRVCYGNDVSSARRVQMADGFARNSNSTRQRTHEARQRILHEWFVLLKSFNEQSSKTHTTVRVENAWTADLIFESRAKLNDKQSCWTSFWPANFIEHKKDYIYILST